MATPAQRTNTWTLDEWYDQSVAGTTGGYGGIRGGYIWGANNYGALGLNDITNRSSPTQIPGSWAHMHGKSGVKADGTLWTWGNDNKGQNGLNEASPTGKYSSPMQVGSGSDWSFIGQSPAHAYAIKTDGTAWTWGYSQFGELGHNDKTSRSSPVQLPGSWSSILVGNGPSFGGHGLGVKTDGTLWSWGYAGSGQLGQNNTTKRSSPTQVGTDTTWGKENYNIAQSVGTSYAIKSDGTLWTMGSSSQGQGGQNNKTDYSSPKQIGTETTWRSVVGQLAGPGQRQVFATKTDGTMWAWGQNSNGSLGLNATGPGPSPTARRRSSPTQIGTDTNWSSKTYGINEQGGGVFLKTDGTMWSWGYDQNTGISGLNLSGAVARSSPCQIGTDTSWVKTSNWSSQVASATTLQ